MSTLKRLIPARTESVEIKMLKRKWMTYGLSKSVSKELRRQRSKGCEWCHRKMNDSEMLSLAVPVERRSVLEICDDCADTLEPINN